MPSPPSATDEWALELALPLLLFIGTAHVLNGLHGLIAGSETHSVALLIGFIAYGLLVYLALAGIGMALFPPRVAYFMGITLMLASFVGYADIHTIGIVDMEVPVDLSVETMAQGGSSTPTGRLTEMLRSDVSIYAIKTAEFVTLVLLLIAVVRHGADPHVQTNQRRPPR